MSFKMKLIPALLVLLLPTGAQATVTNFSNFAPLPSNVPAGSLPESKPFQLANPAWSQVSIANRNAQLAAGHSNSGSWDMITQNETGPNAGRYLFAPFETGNAGIQRTDLLTGTTKTIWQSPAASPALTSHVAFDASYWTPWGSYLTAEESWRGNTSSQSIYGRVFELTNPLAEIGSTNLVHRNVIPRVSHEGVQWDKAKSMYFIDELNGGSIYKYTSAQPQAANGDGYFAAGQTSVLRVGDGNTPNALGNFNWVAITDTAGNALPGGIAYTDLNGVTSVDGRFTTNLPDFKGTDYQRPEDIQMKTLANGNEMLFFTATTTDNVYAVNLTTGIVSTFIDQTTINEATGLAVGGILNSPDNLAIDAAGNMYVIEDQPGGSADIWFVRDADHNGVAESIARWASLSTVGAEPTGLYFDRFNPNVAYVNVQHPASGNDQTIQINAVPEPSTYSMLLAGMGMMGWMARRKKLHA